MEFSPEVIGSITSIAAGVLAFAIKIGKKLWKFYSDWKAKIAAHFSSVKEAENNIKSLLKEVRPNGGSSMRDSVTRIENDLSTVKGDVSKIQARQYAGIDMSESPIFEIGTNGQCIHANPSFLHLVGRNLEEVLGHNWKTCFEQEKEINEAWDRAIKNDTDFRGEFSLLTFDKETLRVSIEAHRQRYGGRTLGWMGRIYPVEE